MGQKAGPDHPPFYKFMKASTAEIVLTNRTLRWSTPAAFNDPFDMQFDLELPHVDEALKAEHLTKHYESMTGVGPCDLNNKLGLVNAFFARRLKETGQTFTRADFDEEMAGAFDEMVQRGAAAIAELQSDLRRHMASEKVLCLTDRIDSVQQWSHYADEHRGVALQFVTPPGVDSPWSQARKVDYADDMPLLLTRGEYTDFTSGRGVMEVERTLHRIIYTKAREWQNENEWRIATGYGRDAKAPHEDIPFNRNELGAVIFGCRVERETKERLAKLAAANFPHARLLQAGKAAREFRVTVDRH